MKKRGQAIFGMSFSVIFSIIIIVFIIATAFFAIKHFLGLNQCTQVGFFYSELQEEIEGAWASSPGSEYSDIYEGKLPASGLFSSKIEYVCFGSLSPQVSGEYQNEQAAIIDYLGYDETDNNFFFYPPEKACGGDLSSFKLKCRDGKTDCMQTSSSFFCVPNSDGKVSIKLEKLGTESMVTVKE